MQNSMKSAAWLRSIFLCGLGLVTNAHAQGITHLIEGKQRTCSQVLAQSTKTCPKRHEQAFERWGARIPAFMASDRLGPLGRPMKDFNYGDLASGGLTACLKADNGENEAQYVDTMSALYPEYRRIAFLPLWFSAMAHLCPEITFPQASGGSKDLRPR